MSAKLDVLKDLQTKKSLYLAPEVDLDHHRKLADRQNGNASWRKKLTFAMKGPAKLTETEFHYFQLYRPEVTEDEISRYIGKERQFEIHDICNSPYWIATSEDKALLELLLSGAQIPSAKTIAVYSQKPRAGFSGMLCSKADVLNFLREATFPVFCKPIDGMFGIGALKILGFSDNLIKLAGRPTETFDDFHTYISRFSIHGYLFQHCLKQAGSISEVWGSAVCTVRFLVLNSNAPLLESAVIKAPCGKAVADNFWQSGNLLGAVDTQTGTVTNVIINTGTGFEQMRMHPDTHRDLAGFTIDYWQEAVQLVLTAATLFPSVRTQSWDIAITDKGPVVIEHNWGGDMNLHQLAHERGVFSRSFQEHVETCAGKPLFN